MNPQEQYRFNVMQTEAKPPRRRALLIIGIALLAGVILIVLLTRTQTPVLPLSEPFAANFAFARQIDNKRVYYFSKSAFVSYDLSTRRTTPMTPLYSLPALITDVRWSEQGALVRATGYSTVDQLYPALVEQRLDPARDYWWFVNFNTDTITLLGDIGSSAGADVRDAVWQGDDTIVYTEKMTYENTRVEVKALTIGQEPATIATVSEDELLEAANKGSLLFTRSTEDAQDLITLNLKNKKSQIVMEDVVDVVATDSRSALVITDSTDAAENEDSIGTLVLYEGGSGNTTKLADTFTGAATWFGDTFIAVGLEHDKQVVFHSNSDDTVDKSELDQATSKDAKIQHYVPVGIHDKRFLLLNNDEQLLVAGKTLPERLPQLPNYNKIRTDLFENTFQSNYRSTEDQYYVYILDNPYEANRQAAMNYFKALGYDPYQLKIKWYAFDGVDTGFALPPDANPNPYLDPEPLPTGEEEDVGD